MKVAGAGHGRNGGDREAHREGGVEISKNERRESAGVAVLKVYAPISAVFCCQ